MTTLPDSLTAALPSRERRCPALALADGRWLAAARAGLYVFPAPSPSEAGAGSGEAADTAGPALFPWYEVARARWEAEGELFALEWVDPSRRPLTGRTEGDPEQFMRHAGEYVDRSIVLRTGHKVHDGPLEPTGGGSGDHHVNAPRAGAYLPDPRILPGPRVVRLHAGQEH